MNYQNDCDEKAKEFIVRLPIFTQNILTYMPEEQSRAEMKALKELFDSFAIVDEFNSFLIVDCYNEIKISLMKWERFADKNLPVSVDFKKLLDQMYEVMKDLYFYEIFGFFSTSVWPKEIVELPFRVFCGCVDGWQREPYLTAEGKVEYADVIRFEDPANKKTPLCITIDQPHLLEPRKKCSLTDEQIKTLTDFVRNNEAIIKLHNAEVIDSGGFLEALQLKNKPEEHKAKYCIEYSYFVNGCSMKIPSKKYYVDMDDQSYWQAKRFYKQLMKEIKAEPVRDYEAFKICSLRILKPQKK